MATKKIISIMLSCWAGG